MWPRTAEERSRGRNTGFVCFMIREDAEEAMDAYQDSDPHFNCGRRLCLRWGKNVKKSVKRGTGGVPIAPIKGSRKGGPRPQKDDTYPHNHHHHDTNNNIQSTSSSGINNTQYHHEITKNYDSLDNNESQLSSQSPTTTSVNHNPNQKKKSVYDSNLHHDTAIHVHLPKDPTRLKFIATVASFVAKDGSILEKAILDKESNNPKFSFLKTPILCEDKNTASSMSMKNHADLLQEQVFYRWRVYAFAQGDGFESWRTEPFVMFEPNGNFWIPPPLLDQDAARREQEEAQKREDTIRMMKDERKKLAGKKGYMTGRQLEHAKFGKVAKGGGTDKNLHEEDLEEWHNLIDRKLCATKESICQVMVFCFDKSGAAKQISQLLKDALLDDRPSVDTRIARLYLMSDVLFNSQQPGVRNAFRYRDAIEAMAPEVFSSLGKHKTGGRMTMNKLRNAVSAVLSAWTNWSVYNVTFLDELQTRFDGKDWNPKVASESTNKDEGTENNETENDIPNVNEVSEEKQEDNENEDQSNIVINVQRGDWVDEEMIPQNKGDPTPVDDDIDGEELSADDDVDGESLSDDDMLNEDTSSEKDDDEALEDTAHHNDEKNVHKM